MSALCFLLRLVVLPLFLGFFLVGGAVYITFLGLAWVILGDTITVYVKFPDWRSL